MMKQQPMPMPIGNPTVNTSLESKEETFQPQLIKSKLKPIDIDNFGEEVTLTRSNSVISLESSSLCASGTPTREVSEVERENKKLLQKIQILEERLSLLTEQFSSFQETVKKEIDNEISANKELTRELKKQQDLISEVVNENRQLKQNLSKEIALATSARSSLKVEIEDRLSVQLAQVNDKTNGCSILFQKEAASVRGELLATTQNMQAAVNRETADRKANVKSLADAINGHTHGTVVSTYSVNRPNQEPIHLAAPHTHTVETTATTQKLTLGYQF